MSARFSFFPTPYPDEVLYSILCRYHMRSGNPGDTTTQKEIWNLKDTAKSLYLPSGLDEIINKLPTNTGLTVDRFIKENTMFPYVFPSLSEHRAEALYAILTGKGTAHRRTYQKAGLINRRPAIPTVLRFCPACIEADTQSYGEPYWHRLHQLPGVTICPTHGQYIRDSNIFVHSTFRKFYPATIELCTMDASAHQNPEGAKELHIQFAKDSMWLLEYGLGYGSAEDLFEKHFQLLEATGYRGHGNTAHCDYRKLNNDIQNFYGRAFLSSLGLFDEEDYFSWVAFFGRQRTSKPPPAIHLLMMRFLAGSPEQFFTSQKTYLPFGKGPWPCHNKVCEFYLKDCIPNLDVNIKQGQPKATFVCPHCGFTYVRGKATPKENQYEGQVRTTDFGWLWREKLKECLSEKKYHVHQTVLEMGYPDTTIRKYAVLMGLLPDSRMPTPKEHRRVKQLPKANNENIQDRRNRWLVLQQNNPQLGRSSLGRLDFENYKWLLANDTDWFNAHSPLASRKTVDWSARDKAYLARIKRAAQDLQERPGRPTWLSISSISNAAGIGNSIYPMIDNLPLCQDFFNSVAESKEEWRKHKIRWAISTLASAGEHLSYNTVRHASGISSRVSKTMRDYIEAEIAQ